MIYRLTKHKREKKKGKKRKKEEKRLCRCSFFSAFAPLIFMGLGEHNAQGCQLPILSPTAFQDRLNHKVNCTEINISHFIQIFHVFRSSFLPFSFHFLSFPYFFSFVGFFSTFILIIFQLFSRQTAFLARLEGRQGTSLTYLFLRPCSDHLPLSACGFFPFVFCPLESPFTSPLHKSRRHVENRLLVLQTNSEYEVREDENGVCPHWLKTPFFSMGNNLVLDQC